MRSRRELGLGLMILCVGLAGCTKAAPEGETSSSDGAAGAVPPPLVHFEKVVESFRAGHLAAAYSDYLPARYDEDLNRLFDKVKALLDEGVFARLETFAGKLAARLVPALKARAESAPGLARLAENFSEPLALLGLESYAGLQEIGVRAWLERIEKGGLGEWLARETQSRLGQPRFSLSRHEGDYARVVLETGEDGEASEGQAEELVVVDGKWVTLGMAASWEKQIEVLEKALDAQLELKRVEPGYVAKQIATWESALDMIAAGLSEAIERLAQGLPLTQVGDGTPSEP